ncbi:MAG: GNAT family N-acetyltransferase [Candidatus Izemoplasmatales bacterium]
MNDILRKQLAIDYCFPEEAVSDHLNHFSEYSPLTGRRRFDGDDCFLKIAVVNGKLLVTGGKTIVTALQDKLRDFCGAWFAEVDTIIWLNRFLEQDGYCIDRLHLFYISESPQAVNTDGLDIIWYDRESVLQFKDDNRFDEAFAFCNSAPDVMGVAMTKGQEILGMAGVSCDSPMMWQLGINVAPNCESKGIGSMLISLLKNVVLEKGLLPYYGTSMSHIASQRVALAAGFKPTFVELITRKIKQ